MTTDEHDLVGLLAAHNLADDVRRFHVGFTLSFEDEAQANATTAPRQAGQPDGVLCRNRGGRNGWNLGNVVHASGMRRAQSNRANRPHQDRHGTLLPSRSRATGAVRHRLRIAGVGHVEQHDLAARVGGAIA